MLKEAGLKDWKTRWYVYVGEKDDFYKVYERLKILRDYKQAVYVMRDKKVHDNIEYIALAMWGNTIGAFKKGDFKETLFQSKRLMPYKKHLSQYFESDNQKKLC
jgi:hypothetical protein